MKKLSHGMKEGGRERGERKQDREAEGGGKYRETEKGRRE